MKEEKITFTYSLASEMSVMEQNIRYQKALQTVSHELSSLDLNRGGGSAQTSGFVFECMDVSKQNRNAMKTCTGKVWDVLDNNGIADLQVTDSAGNITYQQAKIGYHGSNKYKVTGKKYPGQDIVIDKGNKELIEHVKKAGMPVRESQISNKMARNLTEKMKAEGQLRRKLELSNKAPITAQLYAMSEQLKNANVMGLKSAKGAAALTAGISLGKNMYEFIEGNIDLREVFLSSVKDTCVSAGGAYITGCTGYLASGLVANSAVGTLASQAASLIVSTQIGATIVSFGPIVATMSAAAGPVFLVGMAIGTGWSVIKSMKVHSNEYKKDMSRIHGALDLALSSMKASYENLDRTIKETFDFWDQSFDNGFKRMLSAALNNDFTEFSLGLNVVLNVFDAHVLFRSMDEFDKYFYDDNSVLTL